jgi:peptidase inhibitor family I36
MSTIKRFCILAFASVLSIAVAPVNRASAAGPGQHRWGSETMPNAGVCFFRDPDFRGEYFCVPAGESVPRLPGDMNDKISSFRVIGAVDVMVFQNEKFKGRSGRFFTDVRDLRRDGWNDRISSIRVATVTSRWDSVRFPRWGREDRPREGACFYKDVDFRGDYFCVARGASYQTVPPGFNDEISSIRIMGAGGVIITSDVDFRGKTTRLTSDVRDLRRGLWNDRISSLRVY